MARREEMDRERRRRRRRSKKECMSSESEVSEEKQASAVEPGFVRVCVEGR